MARNQDQYTIQINADATRAKKEIADLLKSLKAVGTMNLDKLGLDTQIREASVAADELAIHLKNATNVNTGKLNLVEFNKSIEASGRSMSQLITTLAQGGNVGQQAFRQLTAAIANTQVPIKQTNTLLNNMMTTLKNTVKWELSSAAVHSLESALSGAVSYVEDLNTSLTNIRIVTNKSAEDMAQFAIQANKAAKELSSTTKAYADASLIYFQQGDTEEMVAKKAAITLKAAHSSFNSTAAEMSEYLTAVWNSYKVSGDELQRYVDIMAALGANTATSLEEIATSMQKVAATANTVGVSMEQVSSIIATVSSVTRESAESIGTSYKTIFARIGDLKLGKTDEDGIGLGTVSSQLRAIGVDILDQNQNLRDMGDIITDLGNRWQTMTSAQKTATAQAVAGKRQYTQLMALFDNWDMYGKNLSTAMNSEGTLEQMNSMYEEGLKAAQDRSRASMETLYSSLIDEKVLTKFANATATIADNIANVINALGGLGGVAKTVGGLLLSVFSKKIGSQIKEIGQGIAGFVTGNSTYKQQYLKTFEQTKNGLASQGSPTEAIKQTQNMLSLKQELLKVEDSLTTKQAEYMQSAISSYGEQISELNQLEQEYLDIERTIKNLSSVMQTFGNKTEISQGKNFEVSLMEKIKSIPNYLNLIGDGNGNNAFHDGSYITDSIKRITQFKNIQSIGEEINSYIGQIKPAKGQNIELTTAQINALTEKINLLKQQTQGTPMAGMFDGFSEASLKAKNGLQNLQSEINKTITKSQTGATALVDIFYDILNSMSDGSAKDTLTKTFISILDNADRSGEALKAFKTKVGLTDEQVKRLRETMQNMDTPFNSFTNALSKALGTITSSISSYKMLSNAIKNVSSGSGDLVSNIGSIAMSASMLLPVLKNILDLTKGLGAASPWIAGLSVAAIAVKSIVDGLGQGKIEKRTNEQKDNYDKIINGQSEEFSKTSELIKNYQTLSAQYESTESNQEDLIKSAMELADAYDLVSEKVKIARGDFSTFNKSLSEARKREITSQKENLTTAMSQIEQSVTNGGTYYDIDSADRYLKGYFTEDQWATYRGADQELSLGGVSRWDNVAMNSWGVDRTAEVFQDLYTQFMSEEYQAFLNPYNKRRPEEVAIEAIERFVQLNTKDKTFKFSRGIMDYTDAEGSPFWGYDKFKREFSEEFKDSPLNIALAYNKYDESLAKTKKDPFTAVIENLDIAEGVLDADFVEGLEIIDDKTGGLAWNNLDFEGKLEAYQKYRDVIVPQIKEKQNAVYEEMQAIAKSKGKDSPEYKALEAYSKYLNDVLSDVNQITGSDGVIAKTFEEYLSDSTKRDTALALEKNFDLLDGKNKGNTNLSEFFNLRGELFSAIDRDRSIYTSLAEFGNTDYDKMSLELKAKYDKAVADIISTMLDGTDFADYFDIDAMIRGSVNQGKEAEVIKYLSDKGIESVEQVNSALLTVLQNGVTDLSGKAADAIIAAGQQQIETGQAEKDYSDAIKAQKLFKSDMSQADRQKFVEYFFKDSTTEEIDAFIGKSFDERDQWIAEIVKTKQANMLDQLKVQYEKDKVAYQEMEKLAQGELTALTKLGLDKNEIQEIIDNYIYDDEKGGFVSKSDKSTPYEGLKQDQIESLRRYQEYVASQQQLESQMVLSYGEWQMQQLAIDDTLSSLEKLQKVQQKLSVDFTNLPKKGTLAWRQLATQIGKYNGKYLGQMNSESEQIQAITKATISNIDEQINELITKRNDAQSEREKTEIQSQIDQLIQERERVIREADQAIVNLAISPIIAEAEKKLKDLQEQLNKSQQKADALVKGVDQKYLTYEQQAAITAVDKTFNYSDWLKKSDTERAQAAVVALTQAFLDQKAVIDETQNAYKELQKINFSSISNLKLQEIFKSDDELSKAIIDGVFGEELSSQAIAKLKSIRSEIFSLIEDGASSEEISRIIAGIIKEAIDSGDTELATALARYKDNISNTFSGLSENIQKQAQDAVNAWLSAFNTIAEARKTLLEGGSLIDQLAGDPKKIQELFENFDGDWEEFTEGILNGTIDIEKLQTPEINLEQQYAAAGVTTLSTDREQQKQQFKEQLIEQKPELADNEEELEIQATTMLEQLYKDAITALVKQGIIEKTGDQIAAEAKIMANGGEAGDELLTLINQYLSEAQKRIEFSETLREEQRKRDETIAAVQQAAKVENLVITDGKIEVNGETKASGLMERVDGKNTDYEEYQKLQQAIDRAQQAKYKGESWDSLSQSDRDILGQFGIKDDFSNVDTAATECASALAKCAEAAYQLALAAAKDNGYKQDADGNWTKKDESGKQVKIENPQNDPVIQAIEETKEASESAAASVKDTDYQTMERMAGSVSMTRDELVRYAKALYEINGGTKDFNELSSAEQQELYNIARLAKLAAEGWDEIKNSQKENIKLIQKGDKTNTKYMDSLTSLTKSVKKAFGDSSKVTEKFVEDHIDDIQKMAKGDVEAAERIESALLFEELGEEQFNRQINFDVNSDGVKNELDTMGALLSSFGDEWRDKPIGFEATLDNTPALAGLNELLASGAMTVDQMNSTLATIGWIPQVEYQDITARGEGAADVKGAITATGLMAGQIGTIDGEVKAFEEGHIYLPTIKSARKTGGGSSGANRPSSGRGGGGGNSKPKKLDKKKPENEKERYHYLGQQLKRLNESFTEIDKLKDRTYGNKHLKNLEQEISLLKEQLDVQRDYIKSAKEYLAIDRQRVASLGAIFDADGNITNYEEVMDSIIGKYNEFIDRYNSASASEQENMEEEKEEWDKWYEEKIEWISKYEETLGIINEKQNELLETQNKISEAMLAKIQYKVELKVDINKDEQDLLDYLSEKYDEVIEKQGVIMNNLIRESELAQDNIRALEQSRYELELAFNSGNINQADYVEGLRDINEQLLDNLKTINDVKKDIEELYSDTISDASDIIDKQTQKINNASEAMKSYISILQLLGKGQNYEDLMYFYEKQYDYNKASLQTQIDLLEVLKQEEKYYLDRIDSAQGLTETEREQYEALQETMQEVQNEILSSTENTLQSLQEKYNNTINSIMKNLEESIVGEGNSLAWLSEEYSYYLEEFDRYLSAQKQLYEINKLNRNIDKSIANTTEALYKKQLKQLQDEINARAENNSLSEYELNIMNLKYELLLKQIALEEAQNAKSTVRLTRDSEGNMIYQYTADADEISKAQQEYEDVLQQMVDANYEQVHNVEQQTIEAYQNMVDKIKEIATDETLTQEQKMERIQEIVAQTNDTLRYLMEQYNITSENLMYTNELVSERYNTALWEHSNNAKNNMNMVIEEMIANTDKYVAEMQAACGNGGSIQSALEDYSTKVNEISELTSMRYGDMIDAVQNYDRVTEDAEDETRKMANELRNNLLPQIHTTTNAWDTYYKTLRTSINQTEALISKNNALISSLAQITQSAQRAQSAIISMSSTKVSTPYGGVGGSGSGGSGGTSSSNSKSPSTTNTISDGKYYLTVNGNKVGNGVSSASEAAKMAGLEKKYGNYQSTDTISWAKFAMGGLANYTGPAWLDGTKNKPELVLNPDDTQNMFRTIDAVRQLDKTTLNIMDDFINFATSSMMANMFNLHAGSTNGSSGELQQNVQITAEFPNVQDRNEIEAAFDNLINRASQFISSKGRP